MYHFFFCFLSSEMSFFQAKGPKGQKLALDTKITDPHQLNEIIDPVFSDSVQVHGIKHRSVNKGRELRG